MGLRDLLPAWVEDVEGSSVWKTVLIGGGFGFLGAARQSAFGPLPGWIPISLGGGMIFGATIWIIKDRVV